jgi:hypothetical protein
MIGPRVLEGDLNFFVVIPGGLYYIPFTVVILAVSF